MYYSEWPSPLYLFLFINTGVTTAITLYGSLDESITDPYSQMLSVGDHKRRVPNFCKKYIARRMKTFYGLKYLKLKKKRLDPSRDRYSLENVSRPLVNTVVLTSIQAFAKGRETILYMDECQFPTCQTPEYCWAREGHQPFYNRRTEKRTLHVIDICSQDRFVAIQIYDKRPNSIDIYYFLVNFLLHWDTKEKLVILLDNAGWHVSSLIKESHFKDLLLYNVPRMYVLNLIELTFSKAKAEWRKRPVVERYEEEVEAIVTIFK